jgi:hypothetical protein
MTAPDSPVALQLALALAHLRELRAVFKDQLKREPASDWFQDSADVLDHPGIADSDRLRVALALLATARAKLPAGSDSVPSV